MSEIAANSMSIPTTAESATHNCPELPIGDALETDNSLSIQQLMAIKWLMAGVTHTRAAVKAGVTRRTLYGWRHDDPAFIRELERRRRFLWESSIDRLRAMIPRAINVISTQIRDPYDNARFRAATNILRLTGVRNHVAVKPME